MSTEVVCPSGMRGQVRALKVQEVDMLLNKKALKDPAFEENLIRKCWLECTDPGPYQFVDGRVDWQKVLVADMTHVVIAIRRASWGDEFEFQVQCPEYFCRANFTHEVDLSKLNVIALEGANLDVFSSTNEFEMTLPECGKTVTFKMQTGREKRMLARQETRRMAREQLASTMMALRVVRIEGVSDLELMGFIRNLSVRDQRAFEDALDEVDCGVETKLELTCPECDAEFDHEMPMYSGPFLIPPRKKKTKKERAGGKLGSFAPSSP